MNEKDRFIFGTEHWEVKISDDQLHLGRSVVVLKRPCSDLSELSSDEWSDFHEIVKQYEKLLKKTFNTTMFNWACLMNNAYAEKPYNPQVHWHVRPRYDHIVSFEGSEFNDDDFGSHYKRNADGFSRHVSDELLKKIVVTLRNNL